MCVGPQITATFSVEESGWSYRRKYRRDRENGDEGINLVNIQSEEKYIQAG